MGSRIPDFLSNIQTATELIKTKLRIAQTWQNHHYHGFEQNKNIVKERLLTKYDH